LADGIYLAPTELRECYSNDCYKDFATLSLMKSSIEIKTGKSLKGFRQLADE
jgi:hypothetical protein